MDSALAEQLDGAIEDIDKVCRDPAVSTDIKELLIDLRSLMLDIDHARRHYRRAVKIAALEFARLHPGKTIDVN